MSIVAGTLADSVEWIWGVRVDCCLSGGPHGRFGKTRWLTKTPITSFRLRNLLMDVVFDLAELESVVGPLPYTMTEGVTETVRWMRTKRTN